MSWNLFDQMANVVNNGIFVVAVAAALLIVVGCVYVKATES